MFPSPLSLGPIHISLYGLLTAGGVLAALILFSFTAPRRNMAPALARDFSFWMILAGLIGSRLAYVIFHLNELGGPLDVLAYWRGGLMFQGGVVGALAVSPLVLRRYGLAAWPTADVMAPSLALGQAFGRLGCLTVGCCYGRPAGQGNPLGLVFPPGSLAPAGLPLWPAQAIEALGLFILAAWLVAAVARRPAPERPGRVAGLYLMGAGLLRLGMELFLRGDFRGEAIIFGLPPTTLTALASALIGLFVWLQKKPDAGSQLKN